MTLDEFLAIVANGLCQPSENGGEDLAEPVLSLDEFLSTVSPVCAKALLHRSSSEDKFTVAELLAVFDSSRVTTRPKLTTEEDPCGMSLSDFLVGGNGFLLGEDAMPAAQDDALPPEKEDAAGMSACASVDMSLPSCRPSTSCHVLL